MSPSGLSYFVTVIVAVAFTVPSVTVIIAVPTALAGERPVAEMVATWGAEDAHVTSLFRFAVVESPVAVTPSRTPVFGRLTRSQRDQTEHVGRVKDPGCG